MYTKLYEFYVPIEYLLPRCNIGLNQTQSRYVTYSQEIFFTVHRAKLQLGREIGRVCFSSHLSA